MTDDVRLVTNEQYEEICRLLDRARDLRTRARRPRLSLQQKLDLQRQAKDATDQARNIGT